MKACLRKRKGFSLIEMLVASMLLSASVVALCAIGTRSMSAVKLNRQYETAWSLLDRQLTMIDYMGIEEFLELQQDSGEFDFENTGQEVYQWQASIQQGQTDSVYIVSVSVLWGNGGRERRVSAATIFNVQESSESSDESAGQENETVS